MASRRPRLTVRKQPKQARSRETVEVILQAAAYLLLRTGYDAMTTNQIADKAGVNIASLYQYFPNKQAIVVELMQRHVDRTRAALVPVLERSRGGTTRARVRAVVEATAAEHAVEPKLHALYTTLGPQLGFESPDIDHDGVIGRESAKWVDSMKDELPDPELALWVAQTAIHAVFHIAFVERPDIAATPLLVDEIVRLITLYLEPRRRR